MAISVRNCLFAILAAAALTACGHSAAQSASAGNASTSSSPAVKTAASTATGGDACAEYVQMVTRCIDSKVPDDKRADERRGLRFYQGAFAQTAIARAQCQKHIVSKIRDDEYNCYGQEAVKRGIQTPCTLVTRAEIERAVHQPLGDGEHQGEKCLYAFKENVYMEPLKIEVHWSGGNDDVQASRMAEGFMAKYVPKDTGVSGLVSGGAVEGLGDEAFFTMAAIHPMLIARKGDSSVGVEGAARDAAIEIARIALSRLPSEPDKR